MVVVDYFALVVLVVTVDLFVTLGRHGGPAAEVTVSPAPLAARSSSIVVRRTTEAPMVPAHLYRLAHPMEPGIGCVYRLHSRHRREAPTVPQWDLEETHSLILEYVESLHLFPKSGRLKSEHETDSALEVHMASQLNPDMSCDARLAMDGRLLAFGLESD